MPFTPKPKPPKKCACKACLRLRDKDAARKGFMNVIAVSYKRDELQALVQASRATMLPPPEAKP